MDALAVENNIVGTLTATQEKYLRAVFELTITQEAAQVSQIANHVGVSRATASVALGRLVGDGLAEKRQRRQLALTSLGNLLVVKAYGKQRVIYAYLTQVLGVPEEVAEGDTERLEPLITMETVCALCKHTHKHVGCAKCAAESCT